MVKNVLKVKIMSSNLNPTHITGKKTGKHKIESMNEKKKKKKHWLSENVPG